MSNDALSDAERLLIYGDGSGDVSCDLDLSTFLDLLPRFKKIEIMEKICEKIKGEQLPLRRYTPDNPPKKDYLSSLPVAVPIKPEFKKPKMDFYRSPFEVNDMIIMNAIQQINTPKEKTVMQAKAVFDLYFKRARAALEKAAEDKFRDLVAADENVKKIRSTFDKLNDDLSIPGFRPKLGVPDHQLNIYCTRETRESVDKLSKEESDERRRLDLMQEEVEAQLLSCETYEQARAILRAYDIINNAGEMQEYKPF